MNPVALVVVEPTPKVAMAVITLAALAARVAAVCWTGML
jgi:hypothetical protein